VVVEHTFDTRSSRSRSDRDPIDPTEQQARGRRDG
jgi:hypothetical protein